MKMQIRGLGWRKLLALMPVVLIVILTVAAGGALHAADAAYTTSSCPHCGAPDAQYGLEHQMLFVANGRASNVAVIDVATMSVVDYIPVPYPPVNANALAGQVGATLDKAIQGLGLNAPVHVPDMFYWEVHGVVASADRGSVYAVGALSFTPSDWTMYQVDAKTHQNTRQIPMAISPVGYCGLEYDRNDENSGVLYAESMETGPGDLAALFGSPLLLKDPLAGLLNTLGLGGLLNTVESIVPAGFGGLSEESLASGTNTRFISTDYNGDLSSSTCGIAWNAEGNRAFASQMFEPLIDTINWNTKVVDGEIGPVNPFHASLHQSTSAKSRGLLFTAAGGDGISVYDMNTNALVAQINVNSLVGRSVIVHGPEIAPGNDNVLYATVDGSPGATYVFNVSDVNAPELIGGYEGLDPSDCGTYAIGDKENYYRAAGKCGQPALSYTKSSSYWASYADYQQGDLSVNFNVTVSGGTPAMNVVITGATATNNVSVVSAMPMPLGDLSPEKGAVATIKYNVPADVVSFRTSLSATAESPCGDTFSYPGSNDVGVPPAPRA